MPAPSDSTPPESGSIATSSSDSLRPGSGSQSSAPNEQVELPYPEELQAMLGGAYVIESFLGQGGMGAVYKGLQMPLRRPVAVKILAKGVGEDYGFEERFKREAYAMAALTHPHIVQVYDCGDAGEQFLFISMELVEGGDLSDALKAQQVTPEVALKLMPQICDGLQAAHERGIVHRDIKPANIFLTADGRAKVADFGLAKKFSGAATMVTKTGLGLGTPDYAAPEQYENLPDIDHRADIYSLGVMFYQLLTGRLPRGSWKAPSSRAGTDPRLDDVVLKAMAADRDDRYQTAEALKQDILQITTQAQAAPRAVPAQPMNTAAVPVARTASTPLPGGGRTGAVPTRSGPVGSQPSGPVIPQRTGAVPVRPTGAVPGASRTPSAAVPAYVPAGKKPVSTNLIAGLALAVVALITGAWMFLKPGGGRVIDLLNPEVVKGMPLRGDWISTAEGLRCSTPGWKPDVKDEDRMPMFEFLYTPPEEYDFEIEFSRISGSIVQTMPAGGHVFAHEFIVGPDDGTPQRAGINRLGGVDLNRATEGYAKVVPPPRDGSRHVATMQVRRGSVRSLLDGAEVLNWSGDFSRLEVLPAFRLGGTDAHVGVGSWGGGLTFHRATVREVSGRGQIESGEVLASSSSAPGSISPPQGKVVADWVTSVGGYIVTQTGGVRTKVAKPEEMPETFDRLVEVYVPGARPPSHPPEDVMLILARARELTRLDIRSCQFKTEEVKTLIADKPRLTYFSPSGSNVDDGLLPESLNMPELDTIELSYNSAIAGLTLDRLATLPKLTNLNVGQAPKIGDAAMPKIAQIKGLKYLNLSSTKVTDAGLSALASLPALESLYLRNTDVSVSGLKVLTACPKLRRISISIGKQIKDLGALSEELARSFPGLKELEIEILGGTNEAQNAKELAKLGSLSAIPGLSRLELRGNLTVNAGQIAGLDQLPQLVHLEISYEFRDEHVNVLKGVKLVRILRLGGSKLSDIGALNLASTLPSLRDVNRRVFTEAGLKTFREYRADVKFTD